MQPPPPQPAYGGPQPYPQQQPFPPGPGYALHSVQWPQAAFHQGPPTIDGFPLAQPRLKPIPSGPAIGSLVAGIGGTLGALPGLLFAALSPWAGLTFFTLAALLGGGSILLAVYSKRQIRSAGGGISGRGVATSGLILGIVAAVLAGLALLIALLTL